MRLYNEVERIGKALRVDVAFSSRHLSSGANLQLHGESFQNMCSVAKLPIAITLLDKVDAGDYSLDDMHTVGPEDLRLGGWLTEPLVKRRGRIALSTFTTIDAAMRMSDNAAWRKMVELCGGIQSVHAFYLKHGIEGIRSTDDMFVGYADLLSTWGYERPVGPSGLTSKERAVIFERFLTEERDACTPDAMVGLMAKLCDGTLLEDDSRDLLLDIMKSCETSQNKLRAQLPPGIVVADKTGSFGPLAAADVGIVELPDQRGTVALSLFVRGVNTTASNLDSAIANVGRLLLDYFILMA